jgi:hypothetical protein
MANETGGIFCDIDFEAPGCQVSSLRLDHSDDTHAYGIIPIPIAVLAGGEGPTVLLTAGNHGDEYEGQIILRKLIHELAVERLQGRLIVLAAMNYPAVLAGTRTSPLDRANFNRSFQGRSGGPPTSVIAQFVDSVLLPLCDAGLDLHSGGTTAEFLPCGFLCRPPDRALMQRLVAVAEAFAAPYTYVVNGAGSPTSLDHAAHDRNVALISAELGGGATVGRQALRVGYDGVLNVLHHLGIVEPSGGIVEPSEGIVEPAGSPAPPAATRFLVPVDHNDSVMSPISGLFEPLCSLGDTVVAGQPAGLVHPLDDPAVAPVELCFRHSGVVFSRRVPARVKRGDFVLQIAHETSRESAVVGKKITGVRDRS